MPLFFRHCLVYIVILFVLAARCLVLEPNCFRVRCWERVLACIITLSHKTKICLKTWKLTTQDFTTSCWYDPSTIYFFVVKYKYAKTNLTIYFLLQGQVQSRLQDSVIVAEKVEQDQQSVPKRQSLSPVGHQSRKPQTTTSIPQSQKTKHASSPPNQDRVLSATLKQLQQFGVNIDLDSSQEKTTRATVESAR